MLTAQYFNYAQEAWGGISEEKTKKLNWFLTRKKLDLPFCPDDSLLLRDTSSSIIKTDIVPAICITERIPETIQGYYLKIIGPDKSR